jgi:hypothetical protein
LIEFYRIRRPVAALAQVKDIRYAVPDLWRPTNRGENPA